MRSVHTTHKHTHTHTIHIHRRKRTHLKTQTVVFAGTTIMPVRPSKGICGRNPKHRQKSSEHVSFCILAISTLRARLALLRVLRRARIFSVFTEHSNTATQHTRLTCGLHSENYFQILHWLQPDS